MAARAESKRRDAPGTERRTEIADAALEVLAAEGSRGLTHRAVDEAAGLPAGSTSNHFRTREALLEAAALRHAELDNPPPEDLDAVAAPIPDLTREQAQALVMAALDRVLAPEARPMLTARYELIMESTRRPSLRRVMEGSRAHFVGLTELLLRASGCQNPSQHAAQLIAVMDGITSDQLQADPTALDRDGIEETIARFLASC
ncbi:MAG TPA: TetR family transcriptional regulator [Solirubrobacterales bacterium]|nr:TetR family transcriptional regulator [Solirubrobacterales bacterium]